MGVLTPMRSIWETLVRVVAEAPEDALAKKAANRLARAHAQMAAQGKASSTHDQARRDRMARVIQDPDAARTLFHGDPEDWEDELPGQTVAKGSPEIEPELLPRPDQPAPGTAAGIGAGRIAAKQAQPTSVSLGARARRIDPGVSGIKSKFGVTPDAFFGNRPLIIDPETGKLRDPRGRPKKSREQRIGELEQSLERLQKLLQNPKTDRHAEWLRSQIKDKTAELKQLQSGAGRAEVVHEPFADIHARAMAQASGPKPKRPEPTSFSAGAFDPSKGGVHLPKGGEASGRGGTLKIKPDPEVRQGAFHGQAWSPAGFTAPDEEDWDENPELAARRAGGKTRRRAAFPQHATGQLGRMSVQASPGAGAQSIWNQYLGRWQSPEEFERSNQDLRAKLAAKLAVRGAARSDLGRRPWAGVPQAPGQLVPKDAGTQKAAARAAAVASKPLEIDPRRRAEPAAQEPAKAPSERPPAATGAVDRDELKRRIAARLAQMAAAKAKK